MNTKHKLIFLGMATLIVLQATAGAHVSAELVRMKDRYIELYEMAAYLAGKLEGANISLDEEDRVAMKAMLP